MDWKTSIDIAIELGRSKQVMTLKFLNSHLCSSSLVKNKKKKVEKNNNKFKNLLLTKLILFYKKRWRSRAKKWLKDLVRTLFGILNSHTKLDLFSINKIIISQRWQSLNSSPCTAKNMVKTILRLTA